MTKPDHGKLLLDWIFPSFVRPVRSRRWYTIAGLIGGGSLFFAIFTLNFLFAVILVVITIILVMQARTQPQNVHIGFYEDGVEIGQDYYPYDEFKNFWIAYKPPEVKKLYLTFRNALRPMLIIPLESENPLTIRKTLLEYLPEDLEKEDETTTEALGRLLKL